MPQPNAIIPCRVSRRQSITISPCRDMRRLRVLHIINYKKREERPVELVGADKATVRWLIDHTIGAKTYAMRFFEIKPGGLIPLHQHPEEHEIFVLSGQAKVLGSAEDATAQKDDVIYVAPNEPHGYDNKHSKEAFRFICVIPLLKSE